MYACVSIDSPVCIHVLVCAHTLVCVFVHVCASTSVFCSCVYTCAYMCTCTFVCMHVRKHICVFTHLCVHALVSMCTVFFYTFFLQATAQIWKKMNLPLNFNLPGGWKICAFYRKNPQNIKEETEVHSDASVIFTDQLLTAYAQPQERQTAQIVESFTKSAAVCVCHPCTAFVCFIPTTPDTAWMLSKQSLHCIVGE